MAQPDLQIRFDADFAEWCTNEGASQSVDAPDDALLGQALQARHELIQLVRRTQVNGDPREGVRRTIGAVINYPVRGEFRKRIIAFLKAFESKRPEVPTTEHLATLRRDQLATEWATKKREAKKLYESGRYLEAIAIGLEILYACQEHQYNSGIVGFLANAYFKAGNYEKALEFAQRNMALQDDSPAMLGIAIFSAQKLKRWEDCLKYGKRKDLLRKEVTVYSAMARAAFELNRFPEALTFSENGLAMKPHDAMLFAIAARSAYRLGRKEDCRRYAKQYAQLSQKPSPDILEMGREAAREMGDYEAALELAIASVPELVRRLVQKKMRNVP